MNDGTGHYFEVPAERVDPARREAVALKLPALAKDLDLAALGLKGGLTVRWFRPTTPTQSAVTLPGAAPPETFVAAKGLGGLCRGRDAPGVVWLRADLPLDLQPGGVAHVLAHEAKHAQAFLRPGNAWEAVGEASCDVFADRFVAGLKRAGPGDDDAGRRPPPSAPSRRSTPSTWGPGSPTWVIPWQYTEARAGDGRAGQKYGPGGLEYSSPVPIGRVR